MQHITPSQLQSLLLLDELLSFEAAQINIIARMIKTMKRMQSNIFMNEIKQLQNESHESFSLFTFVKPV